MDRTFELRDELNSILTDAESYVVPNDHDLNNEDPGQLLEGAVESVAESSEAILDPDVFDVYRSLLKHSDAVPGAVMSKLLDSISSGLQAELDATVRDVEQGDQQAYMAHRIPMEMYAFLLQWFVLAAEKVRSSEEEDVAPAPKSRRGRGGKAGARATGRGATKKQSEAWAWSNQIPPTLNLVCKVLQRLSTQRIWTTTAERETFIKCITRAAYHIAENEAYMKDSVVRDHVYKVICLSVKHHNHAFATQINIIQNLQYYEHLSEPYAECLDILAKEFDHTQLGDEVLREISSKTFGGQDSKGPRSFSKFLIKFSELSPRLILKQISLLGPQIDSESYPIRIAIVEVAGNIIRNLDAEDESGDEKQLTKKIAEFYELLLERMLDVSSYVRVKVLSVLTKLCDLKHPFPKQRIAVTRAAISALEDKVASVRKNAVALLNMLILTHPWGKAQGGYLQEEEFEKNYLQIKTELDALESQMGKAVERQDGDEEDGEEEEEEKEDDDDEVADADEDEAEGETKKAKKSKKARGDDEMDVDEDEEETEKTDNEDEPAADAMSVDGANDDQPKKKKGKKLKPRKSQIDVTALSAEQAALMLDGNKIESLKLHKKYYVEALTFIRQIEGCMDMMGQLLGSTSKAEVLEAMEFFRIASEYKFDSAQDGIKKMLHLIWHKDNSSTSEDGKELKGIRSRVLDCYRHLYFDPVPDLDAKAQVVRISKNMIELTYDATLAELTSLEEMMRIMMDDEQVHQDIIDKLWRVYSSSKGLPKAQRRGAIVILGMLALANRRVLNDHVDTMLKVGLGPFGKADLTLARYTCVALQRLNGSAKKIKGSLHDKTIRLDMENPIFRKLQDAVEHPCRNKDWFGLAEQAINTVYALGQHPDVLCNNLIKKLTVRAFSQAPRPKTEQTPIEKDPDAMEDDNGGNISRMSAATSSQDMDQDADKDLGDAFELSQVLFVVGHVAIKHIVYLELVEREWKRQKDEKQAAEKLEHASSNDKGTKDGEELDQVAGNAEDEIGERIAAVRETELLYGEDSLLAVYGPMLVHICGSPHKFKNRTLRAAATLSFSKFLCVSSQFCDQNHRLLFKILETSKSANIRSNIVIALGDVAVSFSTIIDENSNELYKGLSDPDPVVKKNTLMVLTHLILNGMVKVKGQLGEMAKCLEDDDPRIADLAKLFFTELSTKDNAIYNNLPDIISHLSIGEHAVDEETFQKTLKYIFSFIEKEKQAETIVEKLCQRFRLSEEPRQWRDIAFCLSLLPFKSERSVKKLIEGLQYYRDKLHEEKVYERFTEILVKARQNKSPNKPDNELNEFEQILEEHKRQGEADQALENRVKGKKAAAKKKASKKTTRKKVVQNDSDEE